MFYVDQPAISDSSIIDQARDHADKTGDPYWNDKVMPFLRDCASKTLRDLTGKQRNWLHGIKADLKALGYF
jgi:hypothetical protein